jgi:hypothetical protein
VNRLQSVDTPGFLSGLLLAGMRERKCSAKLAGIREASHCEQEFYSRVLRRVVSALVPQVSEQILVPNGIPKIV